MIKENKKKFLELYKNNITRDGADKLLEWLQKTDFFTAPASSKFHSNKEGGLCEHSLNVYNRMKQLCEQEFGDKILEHISEESLAIITLLHDVCKVNTYKQELKNVKVDGNWVQKPFYVVDEELPYGHGEKSVYILSGFIKLTREEAMAINWHMGGFDARVLGGSYALSSAFYKYPIAVLLHMSDFMATYLDEHVEK